ncbi:MAG TPA: hypothetical protein PK339_12265 [Flavitalea sp.]|nr:hypothetical protein [Flavitalea sp.]
MKRFLIYLPILFMIAISSCKKSTGNKEEEEEQRNDLAENNFLINGTKYAANSTIYFDLNNEIISCYQVNPDGYGGFEKKYCIHVFFSGNTLPTQGGVYDVVFFSNLTNANNDKKLSLTVYQNSDAYFSFDAKTYQNPAAGVTQKATVTVANGKVTVNFTDIKLFNTSPTSVPISANIVISQG